MAIPVTRCRSLLLRPLLLPSLLPFFLFLFSGLSLGAPGDAPEFTYRIRANEVRLSFSASDQNDHGVATLQASDVAIVDSDFIVRNFQSFNRSDCTKLELAVVFDSSESVTRQFRRETADILDLLSASAGIPEQNVSLISFEGIQPSLLCAGNCRASEAANRLTSTRASGLTPLFDTIVYASKHLAERGDPQARKILIVFSDGNDTISRATLADALNAAAVGEVQVYSINLDNTERSSPGSGALRRLAAATGGRYFSGRTGARAALNEILEDFHATYTVTYALPSHAIGFHAVRILPTHNLNLQLRSRSGYYYPQPLR